MLLYVINITTFVAQQEYYGAMIILGEVAHLTDEERTLFGGESEQFVGRLACAQVIDDLLARQSLAKAQQQDRSFTGIVAIAEQARTGRLLVLAGRVAAPALVHEIESAFGIPHQAAVLPDGHPDL